MFALSMICIFIVLLVWAAVAFGLTLEAMIEGEADWTEYLTCWIWPILIIAYLGDDLFRFLIKAIRRQTRAS